MNTTSQTPTETPGLFFTEIEPWPDPVAGGELLDTLARLFTTHAVLPPGAEDALALFAIHTHTLDLSDISPILALSSPERRCGKTTVLSLLDGLVSRPVAASNLSASVIFRAVDKHRPTLLIDEADTFLTKNEALRGILNSVHRRGTSYVLRSDGPKYDPRRFSTWCSVVIALIGYLHPTLLDRSIHVRMRRRRASEHVERVRSATIADVTQALRRKIVRWASDSLDLLRDSDPSLSNRLHDREKDNWRPLVAIADAAGGTWPGRARRAAILLSSDTEHSSQVQLLSDLRDWFRDTKAEFVHTKELLAYLASRDDRGWADFHRGRGITAADVAALLRNFGVMPSRARVGAENARGYAFQDCDEAFSSYLEEQPSSQSEEAVPAVPAITDASPETGKTIKKVNIIRSKK